jgi:hypothetical protein
MNDFHSPDALGFIPGVYNYCDRRCERCRFMMQCRIGRLEADDTDYEEAGGPDGLPATHMQRFKRMMDELANAGGPGPDGTNEDHPGDGLSVEEINAMCQLDTEEEAGYQRKRDAAERLAEAHPLNNYGYTYLELCMAWAGTREAKFKALGLDPGSPVHMAGAPLTPDKQILSEAVDELLWFQTLLYTKLRRAIQGTVEDPELDEAMGIPAHMSDWNGTAKLCLHIVERCTGAWEAVAELLPEEALDVAPMQELLVRIKQELDREFPDAPKFIRAGWDAHMGEP